MTIQLPAAVPLLSRWQMEERSWTETDPINCVPKPFSNSELIQLFQQWGTPLKGQEYIFDTRSNSPSRKAQSRIGNVVTRYTSRKMKRRLTTESRKPEFGAVIRYDFDNSTCEFYCQPPSVRIAAPTERKFANGTVRHYLMPTKYTPDILRITWYGPYIEEWKTPGDLEDLAEKMPNRFYRDQDGTWRCPEREKHFGDMGITFCLRSSDENCSQFTDNLDFLADFLSGRCAPLTEDAWAAIQKFTDDLCPMTMGELQKHALPDNTPWNEPLIIDTPPGKFTVDDIYKAIAERRLFVDLTYDDLSETRDTILCRSIAQLDALKASRPLPRAVDNRFTFEVDMGSEFMFKGQAKVYEVSAISSDAVHYFDQQSRDGALMPIPDFKRMMFNRDILLLATAASTDELLATIGALTDEQIIEGKNRYLLVRDIELGRPVRCALSKRQVQRIRKAAREAGESHIAQRRAVTPKRRRGGRSQITDKQLTIVRAAVEEGNTPTNPGVRATYRRYKALSEEAGVELVSKKTFYRHSEFFRSKKDREGPRAVYSEEPATWYLHLTDKVHGGRPFHRVHIDHTQLDVFVEIRGRGGRIYKRRPWLTLAIDAETRAVVGFYLSIHAPSTVSCMMVIRHMVSVYQRTPAIIVVDNGREFLSDAFDKLCDSLNITLQRRPAHQARFGAVIERLFGTLNTEFIHNLAGNTKALRNVRMVTKSVDPLRADLMTFAQLHGLLDEFLFRDYNVRIHPAHDHAPIEYMHRRFECTGRRLTRLTPYDADFYILTCVPPKGSARMLDKQRGVKVCGIWYWSDAFTDRSLRKSQRLPVLVDMWDVSIVYVQIKDKWVRCESALLMKYRKLTSIEWRYVIYEARLRMRGVDDQKLESTLCSVLSDHMLPDAASLTAATRHVYGAAGLVKEAVTAPQVEVSEDAVVFKQFNSTSADTQSIFRNPLPRIQKQLLLNYDNLPTSRPI